MKVNYKNSKVRVAIVFLLAGMSFSSCVPVYQANTLFMPGFEAAGDLVAEASLGSNDICVNAGYAITEEFAVFAGYQNRSIDQRMSASNFFSELGGVWYFKSHSNISSEILGSLGYGQFDYHNNYKPLFAEQNHHQYIRTSFLRTSLQYNMHYNLRPMKLSFGSRLVYAHFNDFHDFIIREACGSLVDLKKGANFSRFYLEPMGTVTYQLKHVDLFVQSGVVLRIHGDVNIFNDNPFVLNLGVRYRMNSMGR